MDDIIRGVTSNRFYFEYLDEWFYVEDDDIFILVNDKWYNWYNCKEQEESND